MESSKVFTRARNNSPTFLKESKDIIKAAQQRKELRANFLSSSLDIPYSWTDASVNSDKKIQLLAEVHTPNKKEIKNFITELKSSAQKEEPLNERRLTIEDLNVGRTNVIPLIKCQCNGVEGLALLNSTLAVSTITKDFVRKIRATDEIITDREEVPNPFNIPLPSFVGRLKFIDLHIGSFHKLFQLYVVKNAASDIQLGVDFLCKSKGIINFQDNSLIIGESPGMKVFFISRREIIRYKVFSDMTSLI